ncbi:MAG: hypothetical protein KIS67_12965 [Verrucomicrobiae bacterium]|nr:hypothetical protein [Verrucomicrobiae bacterium]
MKRGCRTKFNARLAKQLCDAIADGLPITHTCRLAGIAFETYRSYRRAHPEFDMAIESAIARGIEQRLSVVKRAMSSADEAIALRAATWWLTHVSGAREHFSETARVEVSGMNQQVAVLVWPHQQHHENEILDATEDHPARIASGAD